MVIETQNPRINDLGGKSILNTARLEIIANNFIVMVTLLKIAKECGHWALKWAVYMDINNNS